MRKVYPCIETDLAKITHNTKTIVNMCRKINIDVIPVIKVFCAKELIVEAILHGGVSKVADSRISNLEKIKDLKCEKLLLRLPMISEAEDVVKYSDVSLNSEIETIKELSKAAQKFHKIHNIILMVDLGDLREGVLPKNVISTAEQIIKCENINLIGLGTNVTCYGGVIPNKDNLGELIELRNQAEEKLGIKLSVISGGNSSSLYMVINNTMPKGINNLRIGEAILLGRETSFGRKVPNCYNDAFILKSEIIEIKDKPTVPKGNIGMDAFGQKPHFKNIGIRKRAIAAIGRQDIRVEGLNPIDNAVNIFGASSDHLILDITDSRKNYKVGDIVEFNVDYGCLLAAMTSDYVEKYYK